MLRTWYTKQSEKARQAIHVDNNEAIKRTKQIRWEKDQLQCHE